MGQRTCAVCHKRPRWRDGACKQSVSDQGTNRSGVEFECASASVTRCTAHIQALVDLATGPAASITALPSAGQVTHLSRAEGPH
jgi:hypothetical protein